MPLVYFCHHISSNFHMGNRRATRQDLHRTTGFVTGSFSFANWSGHGFYFVSIMRDGFRWQPRPLYPLAIQFSFSPSLKILHGIAPGSTSSGCATNLTLLYSSQYCNGKLGRTSAGVECSYQIGEVNVLAKDRNGLSRW